jgi:queuine/archaeosine tRNA-ribosyltransferase
MGEFINICAGADRNSLPETPVKALLFNVLDHCSSPYKINAAKEMYRTCQPRYLMLDSSGYQLLLAERTAKILSFNSELPLKFTGRKINLAPRHVMESAFNLHPYMPDIVIGLDLPIRKIKDVESPEAEFLKKLEYNVRWTVQSAVWWKEFCPESQFFIPIQCYDLNQFEVFHDKIGGLDCDGYSMPIRNLEIWEIALFLVKFYQLGIRRVHLLGTSKLFAIALCAYMARHYFDWVSLDASSWRKAADNTECYNPFDLSREKFGSRVIINNEFENDCPCPHCTGKTFREIKDLAKKDKLTQLRNHNWWVLENIFHDLYENSRDIVQLEIFLKSRCQKPAEVDGFCNILCLVEMMKDANIGLLQDLLGFGSKRHKPSRARKQTAPA